MKNGMRAIIYPATLLGWVQPGLAADCLFHNGLTQANSLAYYFSLGIMVTLLAMIFGLKILYQNKMNDEDPKNSTAREADATRQLKIGPNLSSWSPARKMDEVEPTGA